MYGNISHELTPEQIAAVQNAIDTINAQFNFLVTLTASERQKIHKLAENDAEMISDVTYCVHNKPEIFPAALDTVEFVRDTTLYDWLDEKHMQLTDLLSRITTTRMALGSEIKVAAQKMYRYVQIAKDTPGMEDIARKMKARYKNKKKKSTDSPDAPTPDSGGNEVPS